MKKILTLVLVLTLIFAFVAPAAFADGAETVAEGTPTVFSVAKQPTSETIKAGSKVIFKSYPQGVNSYTVYWTFEDDKGNVTEAENAPDKFPGLVVELPDQQRIRLRNTPDSMNGLKVQAHFVKSGGETIHSDYAYLWVEPNDDFQPQQYTGTQQAQPANGQCDNPCNAPCAQPATQPCAKIVITKHPYDENFLHDGQSSTYFEAHATNYAWMSWEFKIGDHGYPFSAEEAANSYGVNISGFNDTKLWIHNITWGINGWYVRAVFYDCNGCPTYSNWAFMRLVEYVAPQPCKPVCPPKPCYDPYWTPCSVVVAPVCAVPETTVSYTHTEVDSVTVETTYPGFWF